MVNRSILRAVGLSSVLFLGTLPAEQAWGLTNKTSKMGRIAPTVGAARSLNLGAFGSVGTAVGQPSSAIRHQTLSGGQSLVLPTRSGSGKVAVSAQAEWDLWVDEHTQTPIFIQIKGRSSAAKRATGLSGTEQVLTFVEAHAGLFNLRQRAKLVEQHDRTAGRQHCVCAAPGNCPSGAQRWSRKRRRPLAINGRYPPPTRLPTGLSCLRRPSRAIPMVWATASEEARELLSTTAQLRATSGVKRQTARRIWSGK